MPKTPEHDDTAEAPSINAWEFIGRAPSRDDVIELLKTLPDVWGVPLVSIADFVQALPQTKKVQRPHPSNPNATVTDKISAYTLYVSVAGRITMLQRAAQLNGWVVETQPELVDNGKDSGRIVYREHIKIGFSPYALATFGGNREASDDMPSLPGKWTTVVPLGARTGTAWVPYSGGNNAAGSNPMEKVETSARGRALAAWGFGVLPGSGVASLEEMQGATQNRRAMDNEQQQRPARRSRDRRVADVKQMIEQVRQARGHTVEAQNDIIANRLVEIGGEVAVTGREPGTPIDWSRVTEGQLQLIGNGLAQSLESIRNAANLSGNEDA